MGYAGHLLLAAAFGLVPGGATGSESNFRLRVAVQQREEGRVNPGYHLFELACFDGCVLTTLSLNRCSPTPFEDGALSFVPVVRRSSTREGDLRVHITKDVIVAEETGFDIGGAYTMTLRFGVTGSPPELVRFSGGFVKNSHLADKVLTVEYVPLPKRWQIVKLDCGVDLPGVEPEPGV